MSLPLQLLTPSLYRHHSINHTQLSTHTYLHKSFCKLSSNRRSTLLGITLFLPFLTTNQPAMANGVPLQEFGSDPRALTDTIRVVVPRPKISGNTVEVLKVQGVEVPNDDPVRFDVYVAKLDGDKVGEDLGELAGSLIQESQLSYSRMTGLNLGITKLVKEIGGGDCDKVVVSLVPRMGELRIGGVCIDHMQAE